MRIPIGSKRIFFFSSVVVFATSVVGCEAAAAQDSIPSSSGKTLSELYKAARAPSNAPSTSSSPSTSNSPSNSPSIFVQASYEPGRLEFNKDVNLYLSHGIKANIIAAAGRPVPYANGGSSEERFHAWPDGAAVFVDESESNKGGWIYVSNSEVEKNEGKISLDADVGGGGVGAIKFNANGEIIDYRMLLKGTNRNCNGGKTAWNTWITAEEAEGFDGKVYEVDPTGAREPIEIPLGSQGGRWEAFAHWSKEGDPSKLYAFLTEDAEDGALQRMTIEHPDYENPHRILSQGGAVDYLVLEPNSYFEQTSGEFHWTSNEAEGRASAEMYYPNSEDVEIDGNILCFVAKNMRGFFLLDLEAGTYRFETVGYSGQPDQTTTVYNHDGSKLVYFTEEAHYLMGFLGAQVGVWTRNEEGKYTCILWGDDYSSETTGIEFSPDGRHLYFAYQEDGILFDVTREDGLSFFARTAEPSGESGLPNGENPADGDSALDLVGDALSNLADWFGF